ncbi:Chitin synthase, class 2 [Podochytrium sp. JEL0797]|nr:Chitin synthase, class 2 [Podochytrium sp. JEL0797]
MNVMRLFESGHTVFRKALLLVETFYNLLVLVFSWFNIASIYLCFFFMFNVSPSPEMAVCNHGTPDSPKDDPFYPYGGIVSAVMRGIYIASFISIVVASLGNKPETIKPLLAIVTFVYAVFMLLILTLIFWTIYADVSRIPPYVHSVSVWIEYLQSSPNFMNLVLSMLCTYVFYIISSILYLDPWHPFTCLLQYILISPSFSNVLMVYAFCNIHDISWGTKGQDSVSTAPNVQSKNEQGKQVATTELPSPDFAVVLENLKGMSAELKNPHTVVEKVAHKNSPDDHFKSYRTWVLLWWFLSNFALVYILTNEYIMALMVTPGLANPYLVFLLWSIVGFTAFRFIGSFVYWLEWVYERVSDAI